METYGFDPYEVFYTEDCPHCGHTILQPDNIPGKHQRLCPECLEWFYRQEAENAGKGGRS